LSHEANIAAQNKKRNQSPKAFVLHGKRIEDECHK
jgi:hypothetical protein